jgi:hypothetical protein
LGAFALCVACRDLERFDTGETGAYCGNIVDSDFARSGFSPGLGLRLTLDVDALTVAPGFLSSSDAADGPCSPEPLFEAAALEVTPEIVADPLSLLAFGPNRDHNFVAWARSTCQGSVLAVVSLMHEGSVEVRLLSHTASGPQGGSFGLFQLQREDCELQSNFIEP